MVTNPGPSASATVIVRAAALASPGMSQRSPVTATSTVAPAPNAPEPARESNNRHGVTGTSCDGTVVAAAAGGAETADTTARAGTDSADAARNAADRRCMLDLPNVC